MGEQRDLDEGDRPTTGHKREAASRIDAKMHDRAEAENEAFGEAIEEWKTQHEEDAEGSDPNAAKP
jgi:hypothetical protein